MKTDNDFKRLEGYPEPKELPEHKAEAAAAPAPVATPKPEAAAAPATTADVDEVRGGGFGWAALGGIAAAVIVGAVAYMAGVFSSPEPTGAGTGQVAQVTEAYIIPAGENAPVPTGTVTVVDNTSDPDAVYFFDLNGSSITENEALNAVAKKARETGADVTVDAYTDPSGRTDYNIRLSERRAKAVGDYLVAHGVARDHVKTNGRGPTHAYATPAQDRRAEVHLN